MAIKNPILDAAPPQDNPIVQFAKQGKSGISAFPNPVLGSSTGPVPMTVDDARKMQEKDPTLWQKISKELMKPVGLVATATEEMGEAIGAAATGQVKEAGKILLNAPRKLGGILTGSRTNSFADVLSKNWDAVKMEDDGGKSVAANFWNEGVPKIYGTLIDIAADPLNFIGGGLTKTGEAIRKTEALRKAGESVKVGSKLHTELKALGLADDLTKLALGATKAEQAQIGQRALLTIFANTRWEKTLIKGAPVYSFAEGALKSVKQTGPARFLSKVFSTKTTNEAFDATRQHFRNLNQYRTGVVMDKAIDIQNRIGKLPAEQASRIVDVVETGVRTGIKAVDDIADELTSNFKAIKESEEALGLLKTDIQDYFPHIKAKKSLGEKALTAWQGFKQKFLNGVGAVDETTDAAKFGTAKEFSTNLGSSKERKILKFVGEGGEKIVIGPADDLGLRKINAEKIVSQITERAGHQIGRLQELQKRLLKPEIVKGTEDLKIIIKELRANIPKNTSDFIDEATKIDLGEYNQIIDGVIGEERRKLTLMIDDLERRVLVSGGDEFIKDFSGRVPRLSKPEKIVLAQTKIKEITNFIADQSRRYEFFDYIDKNKKLFKAIRCGGLFLGESKATVSQINEMFGTNFFENRPAFAYAQRALASAKATTSKEFFDSIRQFGANVADEAAEVAGHVAVKGVKELDGLKFAPDVADAIGSYQKAVKPEELNKALRAFDAVQNWWKAQALVAPSYHVRNWVGNLWNNFLGGVVDPKDYFLAGRLQASKAVDFVDDAGRQWDNITLIEAAKKSGVIDQGWYAKDIDLAIGSELGGISINPLKQNFALFRANRAAGQVLENNARLAHFIRRLKEGNTIDNAASSVKKFLFDYGDLTTAEKVVLKRVAPFYTWTRKNIPLQLEKLFQQPAKFGAISKVTKAIESGVEEPNEKYLGDYIKNNIGVRTGSDDKGNTYYFLLGNWLPAAQAIDFLSQPTENMTMMLSPFLKTPIELWANQSSFFEDTFGQPSKIERYPEENQSWLGLTMRKKTAYILKNIRILNELDKLNPGGIFGDAENPSLLNRVAPEAGFRLPGGIGTITTAEKRTGRYTPDVGQGARVLQSMFGKLIPYNPAVAKRFYLWDTETKVRELERAIKDARRDGQKEYAKRLNEELKKVKRDRR